MLSMPTSLKKNIAPLVINKFLGVNTGVSPTEIDIPETPDMVNMVLDNNYILQKRFGYKDVTGKVGDNNYFPDRIVGIYKYCTNILFEYVVIAGNNIYTATSLLDVATFTLRYTMVDESPRYMYRIKFFQMMDKLYILTGNNIYQYDGTNFKNIVDVAYVPTLKRDTTPAGSGTTYEQWNLIGKGFKILFNGDGTSKNYNLGITGLDTTTVIVKVNGAEKTEGIDFSVNRTTGIVTFNTAPPAVSTENVNNVEITAFKTYQDKIHEIEISNVVSLFGGANDTRVFLANTNYNTIYYNGLTPDNEANYFPENNTIIPNSNYEQIMGLCKQYTELVILGSKNIYSLSYDPAATIIFQTKTIAHDTGCTNENSIQLIDNKVTYMAVDGVKQIVQSNIIDERNIVDISKNIFSEIPNYGLVNTCDFNGKYMLFYVGLPGDHLSKVFIYDYTQKDKNNNGIWYVWYDILADILFQENNDLYFANDCNDIRKIYKLKDNTDDSPYTDNGINIDAYWTSKEFDFGTLERMKKVKEIRISLQPSTFSHIELNYYTDKNESQKQIIKRVDTLDFNNIDFNRFSFIVSDKPQIIVIPIKEKKINYLQIRIENNSDEFLGILKIEVEYSFQGKNK